MFRENNFYSVRVKPLLVVSNAFDSKVLLTAKSGNLQERRTLMLFLLVIALVILIITCMLIVVIILILSRETIAGFNHALEENSFEIQQEFFLANLLSFKSRVSRTSKTKIAPEATGTISNDKE